MKNRCESRVFIWSLSVMSFIILQNNSKEKWQDNFKIHKSSQIIQG